MTSLWLGNGGAAGASLERFPFALAHGARSNSLSDRMIHRSGDSTCSDHALAFVGATWKEGKFPRQLLMPLSCFVLGLISMGLGTVLYLLGEGRVLQSMEGTNRVWDLPAGPAVRPTKKARLSFKTGGQRWQSYRLLSLWPDA
jgi:hypothetical protein